jgi:hypothetical protein
MNATMDTGVGAELLFLVITDAGQVNQHADEWVSVQLLAMASVLLPAVAMPVALPALDVPRSLRASASAVGGHAYCRQAYGQVRAAEAMLARHLVDSYLAAPAEPGGRWTLRGWLCFAPLLTVVREMQAAAWFNRLRLLADELGTEGMYDYLLAGLGWSGAVAAAQEHPFSISGAFGPGAR